MNSTNKVRYAKIFNKVIIHHHHPTQYIPFIEKLWTGSEEERTAATHTHKGERSQRSSPARETNYKKKNTKKLKVIIVHFKN